MKNLAKKFMVKKLLLLFVLFFIAGCIPLNKYQPELGVITKARVGDVIFWSTVSNASTAGSLIHTTLTLTKLDENNISIQYQESYGYDRNNTKNMQMDYKVNKDKIMKFQNLEFEVIAIKDGVLHYKRIR